MERNGQLFCYQSHEDAAWEKTAAIKEKLRPKNFTTLAEHEKSNEDHNSSSASSTPAESPQGTPAVLMGSSSPIRKMQRLSKTQTQTKNYFELLN